MSPRARYVPDERVFGRHYRGRPWAIGLAVAVAGLIALVLGYTKHIPFTGHGYELKAVFRNSPVVQPNSPVRIAGVNVGKVLSTDRKGNANEITFTVGSEGQPIHDDARWLRNVYVQRDAIGAARVWDEPVAFTYLAPPGVAVTAAA